jgi:type IV pilus assembly protein PilM
MIEMAIELDPYLWLGVGEGRRPPNAYELLGVPALETDEEVIIAAVGQRCACMFTRRDEVPEEVWDQMFREIEDAALVLLNPDRKSEYDEELSSRTDRGRHSAGKNGSHTRATEAVTMCRVCQSTNPAGRKFCGDCGNPLQRSCNSCGLPCSADDRFCGACGAKLNGDSRPQTDKHEEEFQRADRLQNESQFDEALAILIKLSKSNHSPQSPIAIRAKDQMKLLTARRNQAQEDARQQFAEAAKAYEAQDHRKAQHILESIPRPLQTPPMLELLAKVRRLNEEAESLNRALEQAVAEKKYDGLLEKVSRLLELQPGHPDALKVAARLQERICASAKAKLDDCQYQIALKLMRKIPESVRLPATVELFEQIAETAWMVRELRQSPIADGTLSAIAEKLQARVPNDPITVNLCEKARRRVHKTRETPALVDVPWAAPPKQPFLGVPVERPVDFGPLTLSAELDQSPLLAYPGVFFVAAGLALQGLGRAPLGIDLAPAEDRTMLNKFAQIMRMRIDRSNRTAWGIDMSCSGLKAVKLAWDGRKQMLELVDAAAYDHCKPLNQAANETEEDAIIQATMQQFVKRGDLKNDRVCLGLPARLTLSRQFKLPPAEPGKLDGMVRFEAERQVPFNLKELVWDYQAISDEEDNSPSRFSANNPEKSESGRGRKPLDILLVVIKRDHVKRRLRQMQDVGIHVDVMQCDALALHNWLSLAHSQAAAADAASKNEHEGVVAALDIGDDASNLVVSSPRVAWYRNIGIGSQTFLRAIVQTFNLGIDDANRWKHSPESAPSFSRLFDALDPVFGDLGKDIRAQMDSFHKAYPKHRIQQLLLVGGCSRQHGLLRYLRLGC